MEPIEAYQCFQSIKWYLEKESYDYFKYNGRVSIKQETFDRRRDKYFFSKLAKKPNVEIYIVSNLFRDPKKWVGDILSDENDKEYRRRIGVLNNLKYTVTTELNRYDSYDEAFTVNDGEYPLIVKDYLAGKVMPETIAYSNLICNNQLFTYWANTCNDKFVWPLTQERIRKYGLIAKITKD